MHLVGLIIKKFVTIHGHADVKKIRYSLIEYRPKRSLTQEEKDACVLQHIKCNVYQFYSFLFIYIPFDFYFYIKLQNTFLRSIFFRHVIYITLWILQLKSQSYLER